MAPAKKPAAKARSLVDFVMAKKRAACPVCALPEAIRADLVAARTRKIRRVEQIEWLAEEHGIKVKASDFDTHVSARHDQ